MAVVVRCDQCGKETEQAEPWLDQFGSWMLLDQGPIYHVFCSNECLSTWVTGMPGRIAAVFKKERERERQELERSSTPFRPTWLPLFRVQAKRRNRRR